jgi:RHS repeat-associated protein
MSSLFPSMDAAAFGSFARYGKEHITFDRPGYLYIYLANETAADQEVYFDDLNIVHESAEAGFKVTQVNEYYPFGLTTANSWADPSYLHPGHLYQGLYAQYDSLTGTHTFQLRNYDPALGRWWQTDPYMQFANPYVGMGNMPHMGVDPDGGLVWWAVAASAYIAGSLSAWERGQAGWANPFNWNTRDILWATSVGFTALMIDFNVQHGVPKGGQNYHKLGTRISLEWSDFAHVLGDLPQDVYSLFKIPDINFNNFLVDDHIKEDFKRAITYLSKSSQAKRHISYVSRKGKVVVQLVDWVNKNTGGTLIDWDPRIGLSFDRGYGYHSPATMLFHEILHSYQKFRRPNWYKRTPGNGDSNVDKSYKFYPDKKEKFATRRANRAAAQLGEGLRVGYDDGREVVRGEVDSHEKKDSKEKTLEKYEHYHDILRRLKKKE